VSFIETADKGNRFQVSDRARTSWPRTPSQARLRSTELAAIGPEGHDASVEIPQTRYAITGDGVHIAYQVSGGGPIDLLWSEGWLSHVEILWEYPPYARWMEMLGRSFRVIHFDKRGIGLSDRTASPDLETRMEDVRAVLDAAESERAVLLGEGPDGGGLSAVYAATFPERVYALVLWHFRARAAWAPDYPWGQKPEAVGRYTIEDLSAGWGREDTIVEYSKAMGARTPLDDPAFAPWAARWTRYAAAPGDLFEQARIWYEIDLRGVLPAIHVPTLLLYRRDYAGTSAEEMEYLRGLIPAARVEAVGGRDEQHTSGTRRTSSNPWLAWLTRSDPRKHSSTACSPPYCSPTSWTRRRRAPRWVITRGALSANATISWCEARSLATAGVRSRRWATASWRRSTVPLAGSAAPERSWTVPMRWGSRLGRGCIREK
jgi:pimeloyl-ACP methyl ester carboxylesterase